MLSESQCSWSPDSRVDTLNNRDISDWVSTADEAKPDAGYVSWDGSFKDVDVVTVFLDESPFDALVFNEELLNNISRLLENQDINQLGHYFLIVNLVSNLGMGFVPAVEGDAFIGLRIALDIADIGLICNDGGQKTIK